MGRNQRIEYDGGFYHVISRGNNREYIFKGSLDKQFFINQLKEQKNPLGFKLFGYVFMDNHYHLLLQTTKKLNGAWHSVKLLNGDNFSDFTMITLNMAQP